MNKVRFGMVGGSADAFIGNIHRIAATMDGELELVCGAFSRDYEKSQLLANQIGLAADRVYPSFQALFEGERKLPADQRMEFVSIVTPNALHYPVALAAIEYGFHVFCEKPATSAFTWHSV